MQLLCIWHYSHFTLICCDMTMHYSGSTYQAWDALNTRVCCFCN